LNRRRGKIEAEKEEMEPERGRNYSVEKENGKEEEDTCKGQ
jgi:hypothetical protein